MNLPPPHRLRTPGLPLLAFTLVELALALAVIGFALVAIIGVLPTGLNVQKENRQETIINQDATIWMDALRSGGYDAWLTNSAGLDSLTNYVTAITNHWTSYDEFGGLIAADFDAYTYADSRITSISPPPTMPLTNGFRIVGLLCTPKYQFDPAVPPPRAFVSNYVTIYTRSISGAATEKPPQDNFDVRQLGFTYRITTDVVPYANWDTNWIQTNVVGLTPDEFRVRSNAWFVARTLSQNLYDVRLLFRWPVLPSGNLGSGRQVFRTMVSGRMTNYFGKPYPPAAYPHHFFEPRSYTKVQ